MKKMPIYEIFKINTKRLHRENYNLNLTYEQAVINAEVVGLSSSQTLRKIRELCDYEEDELFIKEYMSIQVDNKSHYKYIKQHGLYINNHKYVRFGCSAGNARSSVVFMIKEDIYNSIHETMLCGVTPFDMVPAKFTTYYTLNSSSTYPIREPRVVVLPDYTETLEHQFDWINSDKTIENKMVKIEDYPPFDGQGLVDVGFAKQIAEDIELDYTPSAFIIRNTYIKGGVLTMDFKKFAKEIAGHDNLIVDLWGDVYNINDIDMILTESQFKLWKGYDSWTSYVDNSHKYGLEWGVTKFTHKNDETHAFTNYQFLQVLELDDNQIKDLCNPTLEWLNDIMGQDVMKSLLYMCGTDKEIKLNTIHDNSLLALIYNNDLIQDTYIKTKIIRSVNKKIRQAYAGKLICDGNFSHMGSDPYALLEYAFGLPVCGLLKNKEHYNGFWNDRNKINVTACRSPLTHYSEVNNLNLIKNKQTEEWYQHIHHCVTVFNIFGCDTMIMADSDFDGDICMVTDKKEFFEGKKPNQYPITFQKRSAEKKKINYNQLHNVDMLSFGTKIGFITNCSTAMYAMLPLFEEGSVEYNELLNRIKYMRKSQGDEIDKSKGIKIDKFPKSWTNIIKDKDGNSQMSQLDMNLLIKKKPYFQKYVYPKLNKNYNEYKSNMNLYSLRNYNTTTEENTDIDFIKLNNDLNPVLDTPSVMNKICHYLESEIAEIKIQRQKQDQCLIDNILIDTNRELLLEYHIFIESCLKQYKQFRKNERENVLDDEEMNKNRFSIYCKQLRKEVFNVINNSIDVANMVVYVGYNSKVQENKDFVWNVFGKEVLQNVITNKQKHIYIPTKDKNGDIIYLGDTYSKKEIKL